LGIYPDHEITPTLQDKIEGRRSSVDHNDKSTTQTIKELMVHKALTKKSIMKYFLLFFL
jgi:hypothetical protein